MKSLSIVGFGQMGASLAAAWRDLDILAIDADPATLAKARERGFRTSERVEESAGSDAVLLAVPVRTAIDLLPKIETPLLLDVAGTKGELVAAYRKSGKETPYVSLHPLAGNERSGIDSADPEMFRGAPFLVLPVQAREEVVEEVEALVRSTGAKPIRMVSAEEHDAAVATTIHLPHVLAYALSHLGKDHVAFAGRSFRDSTRVALSDGTMVRDFLLTNAGATAGAVNRLIEQLTKFRELLAAGDEAGLARLMDEAKRIRGTLDADGAAK